MGNNIEKNHIAKVTYEKTLRASPNKKSGKAATMQAFPAWERGPRQRRICAFVSSTNAPHFPLYSPSVFHTIVTLSAPVGHLPLEGKACDTRISSSKKGGDTASL